MKTHNSLEEYYGYSFTKPSETLGAIYIVRDPRNVISSMCNHYSMDFIEAYNKMTDHNATLSRKNSDGVVTNFSFLGTWSNRYRSWKNNFFIEKNFKFKNFKESQDFVNSVGKISEDEGHHPDIIFGWGYAKINITTHAIEGLSENDFILAAKIDQIFNV